MEITRASHEQIKLTEIGIIKCYKNNISYITTTISDCERSNINGAVWKHIEY